jgi:hypothetical protein
MEHNIECVQLHSEKYFIDIFADEEYRNAWNNKYSSSIIRSEYANSLTASALFDYVSFGIVYMISKWSNALKQIGVVRLNDVDVQMHECCLPFPDEFCKIFFEMCAYAK